MSAPPNPFPDSLPRIRLRQIWEKQLADIHSPVGLYLKLRDRFPNSLLLESADYHGRENALSYLCLEPFSSWKAEKGEAIVEMPGFSRREALIPGADNLVSSLTAFLEAFDPDGDTTPPPVLCRGAFGFLSYPSVAYFESLTLRERDGREPEIPLGFYQLFRFVLVFDHFNDSLYFIETYPRADFGESRLPELKAIIDNRHIAEYPFRKVGEEWANQTDAAFLEAVEKGKTHCRRGDVFQIVLSRRFSQAFHGDDFNVYRMLRSINPSPYLFYFDFGSYRIFGSSPEAQIVISGNKASIFPIAGTFRRTGSDEADARLAETLLADEKENAEHVMLVDLARNDLSRSCSEVVVDQFREVQYYSHVIHLVSKVTGTLLPEVPKLKLVADTFPAGTLSGAPKYRAMELIDEIEPSGRGFYAGCLGFVGFNQDFNHAILIRSFFSRDNRLYFQAGAGVVEASLPENELKEVENKLSALRSALNRASEISSFE